MKQNAYEPSFKIEGTLFSQLVLYRNRDLNVNTACSLIENKTPIQLNPGHYHFVYRHGLPDIARHNGHIVIVWPIYTTETPKATARPAYYTIAKTF